MNELLSNLNLACCYKAMENIKIEGIPRNSIIEEAIKAIQNFPYDCFLIYYLGIKNYAAFGDQREDHEYGYGPKHGSIVFSIGRTSTARSNQTKLGINEIYYLEAYRDFGAKEVDINFLYKRDIYRSQKEFLTLSVVLSRLKELRALEKEYIELLRNTKFEFTKNY